MGMAERDSAAAPKHFEIAIDWGVLQKVVKNKISPVNVRAENHLHLDFEQLHYWNRKCQASMQKYSSQNRRHTRAPT
jgi:hypothetical protein